ncbi:phosphodiester glycosidase family protein [archaeon]|jgi:hypothetical protein|nr:phosphodiester glycosidase family protein [archaeon]MBT4648428.1 phosphodiester glycosidase family protein [archaeon]MBT6821764.1 phosphodiester glycosidase family protein [archaeon]MBT7391206.1 phosphodiester glycosidase family protein [archaeon]
MVFGFLKWLLPLFLAVSAGLYVGSFIDYFIEDAFDLGVEDEELFEGITYNRIKCVPEQIKNAIDAKGTGLPVKRTPINEENEKESSLLPELKSARDVTGLVVSNIDNNGQNYNNLIEIVCKETGDNQIKIHVVEIDLDADGINFLVTPPNTIEDRDYIDYPRNKITAKVANIDEISEKNMNRLPEKAKLENLMILAMRPYRCTKENVDTEECFVSFFVKKECISNENSENRREFENNLDNCFLDLLEYSFENKDENILKKDKYILKNKNFEDLKSCFLEEQINTCLNEILIKICPNKDPKTCLEKFMIPEVCLESSFPDTCYPLEARTTTEFIDEYDLQLAVNGDFFYPWKPGAIPNMNILSKWMGAYPNSGQRVNIFGYAASYDSESEQKYTYEYSKSLWDWPIIYITENNEVFLNKRPANGVNFNAISGEDTIVKDGKALGPFIVDNTNPRTVISYCEKDGFRKLLFFVVDGREIGSKGIRKENLANIIAEYSDCPSKFAINLDGGGSTTLAINKNGKIKTLNHPTSHKLQPPTWNFERPVANHLGVRANKI